MNPNPKVYFPNLDGLRFFCFLSVFFFHSFATNYESVKQDSLYGIQDFVFANGNLGVNFFFVLSGFLITYLLFTEKARFKKVNIPHFYTRRVLRIWPLFYFCVFFGFVIFPYLKQTFGDIPNETANPWYYLFFLNNLDFVNKGLPDSSVLGILWSVAIEEQFYLAWPLIIGLFTIRNILLTFFVIIVGTFVFRYAYSHNALYLENHTLSCISDMAVGGLFAYLSFSSKTFISKVAEAPKWIWIVLYVAVSMIFLFRQQVFDHTDFLKAVDRFFISILFAFVILEQNYAKRSLFKMSNFKIISKLGTYTYGLYCLHMIGILIAAKGLAFLGWNKNIYQVLFLEGFLSLAITFILAVTSYHLFEKRFLKLKDNFALVKTENAQNHTNTQPPGRWWSRTERHILNQVHGPRL